METGGNSDSGGPDDGMAGGSASGGGKDEPDEGGGPDVNGSAGGTRGANGLRARWLKPHASQNIPDTGAPQPGQVTPWFAAPPSSP